MNPAQTSQGDERLRELYAMLHGVPDIVCDAVQDGSGALLVGPRRHPLLRKPLLTMNPKTSGLAVIIGRFQPFHVGHQALVRHALNTHSRVLVLIGATGCAPNFRNPWRAGEVAAMIEAAFPLEANAGRLLLDAVFDNPYDDGEWAEGVRRVVAFYDLDQGVTLIGHRKDETSFYLDLFPEWQLQEFAPSIELDATELRWKLFLPEVYGPLPRELVGEPVLEVALGVGPKLLKSLAAEAAEIHAHRRAWDSTGARQYELQHNAVDILARDPDGALLLIRRGGAVGEGQLAMPGGFVNRGERLLAAAVREFREEVGIALEPAQYAGKALHCFDHPGRSMRGRIFTHVLVTELTAEQAAQAQAGDDAAALVRVPLGELRSLRGQFFSDHYHIIRALLQPI